MVNVQIWAFEAFHFVYRLELLQADGAFCFVQLLFQPMLLEVSLERLLVLTSLFVTKKLILSLLPHEPKLLEIQLYQDAQRLYLFRKNFIVEKPIANVGWAVDPQIMRKLHAKKIESHQLKVAIIPEVEEPQYIENLHPPVFLNVLLPYHLPLLAGHLPILLIPFVYNKAAQIELKLIRGIHKPNPRKFIHHLYLIPVWVLCIRCEQIHSSELYKSEDSVIDREWEEYKEQRRIF